MQSKYRQTLSSIFSDELWSKISLKQCATLSFSAILQLISFAFNVHLTFLRGKKMKPNYLTKTNRIIFTVILLLASASASGRCGVLRWPVKTGSDSDIAKVAINQLHTTTVDELINLSLPTTLPQNNRIVPIETEVYQIQTTLLEINQTDDGDYHLLIVGSSGLTMVAEIPNPICVADSSPVKAQIIAVRKHIDQQIQVTGQVQKINIPISITGIGFYDVPHAIGSAANGIELHPVLSVDFLNKNLEFSTYSLQKAVHTENAIPNFLEVTNSIFRGGRPNDGDLASLKSEKNIKTVINLENKEPFIQQESRIANNLSLNFISSPMDAMVRPTDQQVNQILETLQNPDNFPIFLHCHHGQDRTGLIIGLYRVEVQGWTPAKAYQEMLANGFHPNLVPLDKYFKDRTGYRN